MNMCLMGFLMLARFLQWRHKLATLFLVSWELYCNLLTRRVG